jgi:hypothetical protein
MRIVLIATGVGVLVGRKLLAAVAFGALCLLGMGFVLNSILKPYIRNAKTLWLAFRVRRVTRQIRATTRRVVAEHGKLNASSGV